MPLISVAESASRAARALRPQRTIPLSWVGLVERHGDWLLAGGRHRLLRHARAHQPDFVRPDRPTRPRQR
jgi:hypothetical protein